MMDERWWMEAVDDGWSMGEDGWKTVDVESNNIGKRIYLLEYSQSCNK